MHLINTIHSEFTRLLPLFDADAYDLHQTIEQNLEIQLAMVGVRPSDIDTVILSHMHFDHTGNVHLFKHADIYAPKADFMYSQTMVRVFNTFTALT